MTDPLRVLILDDDFRVGLLHQSIVDDQPGFTALEPVRSLAEARSASARRALTCSWPMSSCPTETASLW